MSLNYFRDKLPQVEESVDDQTLRTTLYVESKKSGPSRCHSVSPLTHMSSLMGILLSLLNTYTVKCGLELIFPQTGCYPLESFVAS